MSPEKSLADINKLRRKLVENLHWDLETVDNQDYFQLTELYSKKQKKQEMIPLADFLKRVPKNR